MFILLQKPWPNKKRRKCCRKNTYWVREREEWVCIKNQKPHFWNPFPETKSLNPKPTQWSALCFEVSLSTLAIFFTHLPFKTTQFQDLPHSPPRLGPDSGSGSTPPRTTRPRPLKTPALLQIQRPAWHNPRRRMSPLTSRTSVTKVNSMATYDSVWLPRKLEQQNP